VLQRTPGTFYVLTYHRGPAPLNTALALMDRARANALLRQSFAGPCATPSGWREDREAYLAEQRAALEASQIEPVLVRAVACDWAQRFVEGSDSAVRSFYGIARVEDTWLLYSEETGLFAKAWGPEPSEPLSLLGFASADALAEWLG
jgi:hypothetical protein